MPRENYRRGGGRRRSERNRSSRERNFPICHICNKPIRDESTAIATHEKNVTSHFDCVLAELRKSEELQPNEKICYLGKGSFGIISIRSSGGPIRFLIRKRIQFEQKDQASQWQDPAN